MTYIKKIKQIVAKQPFIYSPIVKYKALQFEDQFRSLCDYYHKEANKKKLTYDEEQQKTIVQNLVSHQKQRAVSWENLNVFFIDDNGSYTEKQFHPGFHGISNFFTINWKEVCGATPVTPSWPQCKRVANEKLIERIKSLHAREGIHVVIISCNPGAINLQTVIDLNELGIPSIRYNADDKQNFHKHSEGKPGNCPIVKEYTLCWTTARECALWIIAEGGRSLFLPEGAAPELFFPIRTNFDSNVSFLGLRYGPRGKMIQNIRNRGVSVKAFGPGWENGFVPWEKMREVFSSSRVNLGVGGVGHSNRLTCLKGRDFEIPMAGGLYLTTYNPELTQFFHVGKEILCYKTEDEAVELIRYYLNHPVEAEAIRIAGRERTINNHTWQHRFKYILSFIGVLIP